MIVAHFIAGIFSEDQNKISMEMMRISYDFHSSHMMADYLIMRVMG